MRPFLIALEGIDGAGTTTQVPRLAAVLRGRGHRVVTCAQPSGGAIGRMVRACLRRELEVPEAALALLFAADRLAQLAAELPDAAAADAPAGPRPVAICDRYLMSSWAYQGSRLPLVWVRAINELAPPADLTVYFRVSLSTALARRQARGGVAERFDAAAAQAAVAAAYERLVAAGPDPGPLEILDAEADVDSVAAALATLVAPHLPGARLAAGPPGPAP